MEKENKMVVVPLDRINSIVNNYVKLCYTTNLLTAILDIRNLKYVMTVEDFCEIVKIDPVMFRVFMDKKRTKYAYRDRLRMYGMFDLVRAAEEFTRAERLQKVRVPVPVK